LTPQVLPQKEAKVMAVAMVPGMRKANRRVHLIVRAKEKMEAGDIFFGLTEWAKFRRFF